MTLFHSFLALRYFSVASLTIVARIGKFLGSNNAAKEKSKLQPLLG